MQATMALGSAMLALAGVMMKRKKEDDAQS